MSIVLYKGKIGAEDIFLDAATHTVLTSKKTTRQVTGLAAYFLPLAGGTVTGAVTLSAAGTALAVTNNATVGGTLSVTGAVSLASTLEVSGAVSLLSSVTVASLQVAGAFAAAAGGFTGSLTVGSTLGVSGAVTLGAGLTISSGALSGVSASFSSTLTVSGISTFNNAVNMISGLTVVSGAVNMTGATSISLGSVSSNGKLTLTKGSGVALALTANATIGGTLSVTGVSTLNGGIVINTHTLTYDVSDAEWQLDDNTKVTGNLEVTGDITIGGSGVVPVAASTGCAQLPASSDSLPTAGADYLNQLFIRSTDAAYGVYFCVRYGVSSYKWMAVSAEPVGGGTAEQLEYTWTPA